MVLIIRGDKGADIWHSWKTCSKATESPWTVFYRYEFEGDSVTKCDAHMLQFFKPVVNSRILLIIVTYVPSFRVQLEESSRAMLHYWWSQKPGKRSIDQNPLLITVAH